MASLLYFPYSILVSSVAANLRFSSRPADPPLSWAGLTVYDRTLLFRNISLGRVEVNGGKISHNDYSVNRYLVDSFLAFVHCEICGKNRVPNTRWCRWPDSNRHDFLRSQDFKSCASAISPHRQAHKNWRLPQVVCIKEMVLSPISPTIAVSLASIIKLLVSKPPLAFKRI